MPEPRYIAARIPSPEYAHHPWGVFDSKTNRFVEFTHLATEESALSVAEAYQEAWERSLQPKMD